MKWRGATPRIWLTLASLVLLAPTALGVPLGYRYIGSRLVSEGRVVFWYWNVDYVEVRNRATLAPAAPHDRQLVVVAAAWLGKTRLIDNIEMVASA